MKVLVANRGEIACRILRTLRAMQVPSVAVYTPVDKTAAHLYQADQVVPLDAALGARGYLHSAALLAAAQISGATAVHPGYGFLSQNPDFAAACAAAGLIFIGPGPAAMASLGDKGRARQMAVAQHIPVIAGLQEIGANAEAALAAAALGYPVLIKAAAGGGGKGIRRVPTPELLPQALAAAGREAQHTFGDARLLLEKCIAPARHIEVQVLGDGHGAIALGERECSLQRRYQKIIEESPAPKLAEALRQRLHKAAVRLVAAAKYCGAATVEFLVDAAGDYYFLEVNTRLQVEHPVTEMCWGLDIVQTQVQLAHGQRVADVPHHASWGHAIEARLNAENPAMDFVPSTGRIEAVIWPQGPGIRVDAGVEAGSHVGPDYDPLLAKIVAWAPTRTMCQARLVGALQELVLLGVQTNQSFLLSLLDSQPFIAADLCTSSVEDGLWPERAAPEPVVSLGRALLERAAATPRSAAGGGVPADRYSPWHTLTAVRTGPCGTI